MYSLIQNSSEFSYYLSICESLVNDKLAPTVEQLCRFHGDQDAEEQLHAKAEHLVGRVSRATSRTEDELAAEYEQLQKINTAPNKNAKTARTVLEYAANDFPTRLLAVADLKFRLMQCTTSMKHRMVIPSFGADRTFRELEKQRFLQQHRRTASSDSATDEEEVAASLQHLDEREEGPEFLQMCRAGAEAAIVELLATGRHREALDACLHVLPPVDRTHIHELTFRSLLVESLQIIVGHVDQSSRTVKTPGSSAPSSNASPTSAAPSTSTVSSSTVQQQQQQPPTADAQQQQQQQQSPPHKKKLPFPVPSENQAAVSSVLPQYDPAMTDQQVFDVLRRFYMTFVPDYVESVSYLCEQHRGNYSALFDLVREKYAPVVAAKIAAATASFSSSSGEHDGPAMAVVEQPAAAQQQHQQAATADGDAAVAIAVDPSKPTVSGPAENCALQ